MATYTKETALYDTGAIAGDINDAQTRIDEVDAQVVENNQDTLDSLAEINKSLYGDGDTQTGLSGLLNSAIADLSELSTNYSVMFGDIYSYMKFGKDSQNRPVLTLGSDSSPFKLNITNDAVQFTYGGNANPIAYLTGTALRVQNMLSFGNFILYQRENGHLTIKYIGGDE